MCAEGRFQSQTGQTSCIACPCGKYTGGSGTHSLCKQCAAGSNAPTCTGCQKVAPVPQQLAVSLTSTLKVDVAALSSRTGALLAVDECQSELATCASTFDAEKSFSVATSATLEATKAAAQARVVDAAKDAQAAAAALLNASNALATATADADAKAAQAAATVKAHAEAMAAAEAKAAADANLTETAAAKARADAKTAQDAIIESNRQMHLDAITKSNATAAECKVQLLNATNETATLQHRTNALSATLRAAEAAAAVAAGKAVADATAAGVAAAATLADTMAAKDAIIEHVRLERLRANATAAQCDLQLASVEAAKISAIGETGFDCTAQLASASRGTVSLDADGNGMVDVRDAMTLYIATMLQGFGAKSLLVRFRTLHNAMPVAVTDIDTILNTVATARAEV